MLDTPRTPTQVRFRQIADSDVNDVVELLTRGFAPRRSRRFWQDMMARLAAHATPPGAPRYGYMLDDGNAPVGTKLYYTNKGQPLLLKREVRAEVTEVRGWSRLMGAGAPRAGSPPPEANSCGKSTVAAGLLGCEGSR